MFDETHETSTDTGTPRRSAPGQLRLQLPHQSEPVRRGRHVEGSGATEGGAGASGLLSMLGQGIDDLFPF
ncbi:hypothetical protein [Streptomyces sp. NPDC047981]|uniref:hypothetical protein n=1 Tax=Streptomyces sp. NPDC047981 TaxID=3154610 RepID=UPI003431F46D